jgi:flagellar biogenesis protein FliO
MERKKRNKTRDIAKIEWFGTGLIFIIALVAGYFYTIHRLQSSDYNSADDTVISEHSETDALE